MAVLDENRVRQALLAAKIQSFSSDLVALQSCRDEDELYALLLKAVEGEPFLMSRVVRSANSAAFAGSGGYAVGASECLMRIGLASAKQIAEDFLIDQALGRIVRANRFSRSIWREARLAGQVSRLFRTHCEQPFDYAGPVLPAIMSFLGELFVMSLVKAEYEAPPLSFPPGESADFNLVNLSLLVLEQLQLPQIIGDAIASTSRLNEAEAVPYVRSAAAVVLARVLVKSVDGAQSFAALVDSDAIAEALAKLNLSEDQFEVMKTDARNIIRAI